MVSECQTIKKLWAGHESAQTDGQTDGQTDNVISIYPLNFVRGAYNNSAFIYGVFLNNKIYITDVKQNGLKIKLKIVVSIQCYRRRPQHVRLCTLLCDVVCFDCNRRKPQTMYISNLAS